MFVQSNEVHFLSKKEQDLLLLKTSKIHHKLMILLMMDAGLRVSEVCTLKLANFDFKKKNLNVKSLKRRESSKKLYRNIPLSSRLYAVMADYLYNNKHLTKEDYLFPSDTKQGHLSRDAANKFLLRLNDNLNIKNLHPHALRHTFATNHIASGTPLENVKEMLGHERYDTTLIYTHIPAEILRKNVDTVNLSTDTNALSIGRGNELNSVENLVNRDINTLIIGDIGTGKSHLLEHITLNKKVLKLDDTDSIKTSLIFLLLFLYKNEKEAIKELLYTDLSLDQIKTKINRTSTLNICEEIRKVVSPKEYILMIDNVDKITPRSVKVWKS